MSSAQRRVLVVALAVAILMLVFPPWETPAGHFLGYAPVMAPPSFEETRPEEGGWAFPKPEPIGRISMGLLTAQFAALWIGAGAVFLLLGRREKGDDAAKGPESPGG